MAIFVFKVWQQTRKRVICCIFRRTDQKKKKGARGGIVSLKLPICPSSSFSILSGLSLLSPSGTDGSTFDDSLSSPTLAIVEISKCCGFFGPPSNSAQFPWEMMRCSRTKEKEPHVYAQQCGKTFCAKTEPKKQDARNNFPTVLKGRFVARLFERENTILFFLFLFPLSNHMPFQGSLPSLFFYLRRSRWS